MTADLGTYFDDMARRADHLAALVAEIERRGIPVAVEPATFTELAVAVRARNIGQMKRLLDLLAGQLRGWRPTHAAAHGRRTAG